jgi:hypothetical protein
MDESKRFRAQPAEEALPSTLFPGISPLDFYLLGKGESALIGLKIPDENNFLEAVTEILNDVSDAKLQDAFQSWIDRAERVIEAGGGYFTS